MGRAKVPFDQIQRKIMFQVPGTITRNVEEFAPFNGPFTCNSVTGRWRAKHDADKDGKCIFCNKQVAG